MLESKSGSPSDVAPLREARVGLLIPTHALPVLSYRVPDHLEEKVRPGTAVVAPLSGYSRLGIVMSVVEGEDDSLEHLHDALDELSLPPALTDVCSRLSELFAIPLPSVLRAALPAGLNAGRYRVADPAPDWPWRSGTIVGRSTLRRALGGEGLKEAENEGRLQFVATAPEPAHTEWAEIQAEAAEPNLGRAPRQKELYEALVARGGERPASDLLSETGASRAILRQLVRRGAVQLVRRSEAPLVLEARGPRMSSTVAYARDAGRVADRGGAWFWRVPTRQQPAAVAAFVEAVVEGGEQALVLAPEVELVERLVEYLAKNLPEGCTVAAYHAGLGKKRGAVYEKVRRDGIDALVGTRTAALLPMERLGAVCIIDEPNRAHRAEPGYEGLPVHVREIALERGRVEDCGVLFLSSFPTLRVSAPVSGARELPARLPRRWPAVRVVDTRGSGANLSAELVDLCRRSLEEGKRIALVANRLGYATSVYCYRCGAVKSCPECDIPMSLHQRAGTLACSRCGYRQEYSGRCELCGSGRVRAAGLAIDRLRDEISRQLDAPVGKLAAEVRELEDARVVVATARFVVGGDWDVVAVPEVDALLSGSYMRATEQAFRLLYGAAEAARDLILVQTRQPEHHVLQTALRGDYPAFAEAEATRLRELGYPPYGHLAALMLEGKEEAVRRAVESQLRPLLEPGVSMSRPIPLARQGRNPAWRVLLRSSDQRAVARCGVFAARLAAKTRGANGLKARVEVDPEEV